VLLVSDAAGAHCTHEYDALVHHVGDVATLINQINALSTTSGLFERLRANSLSGAAGLTWESAASRLAEQYLRITRCDCSEDVATECGTGA
jgi:hypothetical protein